MPVSKHDAEEWVPVSRLREAFVGFIVWLDASAGEGRSEKIMLQNYAWPAWFASWMISRRLPTGSDTWNRRMCGRSVSHFGS